MSTNRSFLSHLFAALRPQRFLKPAALTSQTQQASAVSTSPHLTSPRPYASTALSQSRQQQHRALSASSRSTSPTPIPTFGTSPPKQIQLGPSNSPQQSRPTVQGSTTAPLSTSPRGMNIPQASTSAYARPSRQRRGSDISDGEVRETRNEGWWIGGQTANGDERWLRLGLVRRSVSMERSVDRLSL